MKFGKMKTHRRNRLLLIAFLVFGSGTAVALALSALNENINLFYAPDQIAAGEAPVGKTIRAGGMVKDGSIVRSKSDLKVRFVISDMQEAEVTIQYEGVLPDLFREGQGVIARGELNDSGVFMAEEVLAKHDENYMPPEVMDALAEAHDKAQVDGSVVNGSGYQQATSEPSSYKSSYDQKYEPKKQDEQQETTSGSGY